MKLGNHLWTGLLLIGRSRVLTALPLFTYLLLSSVYFLALLRIGDGAGAYPLYWVSTNIDDSSEKFAAELLKQKFQLAGYGLTLVLLLFRLKEFVQFWFIEKTLLVIFVILLLTTQVSDNPDRVLTNTMHLVFGVIAAWLYFAHETRQRTPVRHAALIVFTSVILIQLGSFLWFIAHPDGTVYAIFDGLRTGGLAGNPNTFGGICIVSAWAVLSLIYTQKSYGRASVLWLIPIVIVIFNVWSTGSASSELIVAILFLGYIFGGSFNVLDKKKQAILLLVLAASFFGLIFWLVVQQNILSIAESATDSVGKDLTFTGRIDLWAIALDAIAERPLLGWSYDNHDTVLGNPLYSQKYNHFHNGFLDTIIVGGVLLAAAVLANFYVFASRTRRLSGLGYSVFPLLMGAMAACLHNMTEYSMFRNNTLVWMVYIVCFVVACLVLTSREIKLGQSVSRSTRSRKVRRRSRSKGSSSKGSRSYSW